MEVSRWILSNRQLQDLNPLIAGQQQCPPLHRYGPHIRQYVLLHQVLSGKGTLYARGNVYPVSRGQVFLIRPGEVTTYEADRDDPWCYRWIGFDGSLSRRFSQLPAVFSLDAQYLDPLFPSASTEAPEFHMAAGLLKLYAHLFPSNTGANLHVQKVIGLIRSSYMQPLRVESLARELNLDRRYLSRLFKEKTGMSMQQYLIRTRMDAAARCLQQGYNVNTTARLCGYEDVSNFSKMYKKHFGCPPKSAQVSGTGVATPLPDDQ